MPLPRSLARANRHVTNRIARQFAGWLRPFAVVSHKGRKTGRSYETPIMVFRSGTTFAIVLTYGPTTEWVQNVQHAGGCTLLYGGQRLRLTNPRLTTRTDAPWIPLPVRLILELIQADHVLLLTRV